MDPILPLSPNGDATAQASPAVAMMRAAADAKRRALAQTDLQNQYKASEEARMNQQNALAATREQHLQTQDQNAAAGRTMAGDMAVTSQDPAYRGKNWDAVQSVDPTLASSYRDRYGVDAMGGARAMWDANVPKVDRALRDQATRSGYSFPPDATDDEVRTGLTEHLQQQQAAKANQVPSNIRTQLINANRWKEGMTQEDAGNALDKFYSESGRIPDRYLTQATKMMASIPHNPILAPFAKQREAYDTMKSGFQHPESGGFGDMAMIEGFQRIVNPGAVVRQGTMDNMKAAAGWLQQLDPSFQWGNATIGDKLSPEARQRLMSLADANFAVSQRAAARELASKRQLAVQLGIPPEMAENFVNSVLSYVANDAGEQQPAQGQNLPPAATGQPSQPPVNPALTPVHPGAGIAGGQQPFAPPDIVADQRNPIQRVAGAQAPAPQQPAQVRMQSPEGDFYMIPAANAQAARARGFK